MRPPISVILAIGRAVEQAGGDLSDAEDLIDTWSRVEARNSLRADAIRRREAARRCCCADRPALGRDGRCSRCYGWPREATPTGCGGSTE